MLDKGNVKDKSQSGRPTATHDTQLNEIKENTNCSITNLSGTNDIGHGAVLKSI